MRSSLVVLWVVAGCARKEAPPVPVATPAPEGPSVPAVAVPSTSKWVLDAENSSAHFVVKHVLTNVRGMFAQPKGTVVFDEAAAANSQVTASIAVAGLSTGVDERDAHLKGPEFFDAARYPTLDFVSTNVTRTAPNAWSVTGNLTMHGVTKPATLAVTATPPFNHAMQVRRGIEATTTVNRRDFGLLWDFPGEGTGVVVGDQIKVSVDAELVLQP